MAKILVLDQSSKCSGYAIFENNKLIDYGHISVNDKNLGKRLHDFREFIIKLINTHKIEEVIFEDIQLQDKNSSSVQFTNGASNVKTYRILAEVIGVLEELLTFKEIKYTICPPTTWKSKIGILGGGRDKEKQKA